jgi:hypothetical protein
MRSRRSCHRVAFDTKKNPYGAKLNAIFSSDVVDMRGVRAEAYELIEMDC